MGIDTEIGVFLPAERLKGQTYTRGAATTAQPCDLLPALVLQETQAWATSHASEELKLFPTTTKATSKLFLPGPSACPMV